ncbi:MAG: MerR family transcriptional regulator [Cyanobacteria bacterium P01_D01_bin.123]
MLRISDFAQLSRVSTKALRLYDRLDLLKPTHVDRQTGYRYYSAAQLPRLNRILVFKTLGFSLERIAQLLDADVSANQIRAMLQLKHAELLQHLERDRLRLLQVEMRLNELEREGTMSTYDVLTKSVAAQPVAATIGLIPTYEDCEPIFNRMFDTAFQYAFQQGIKQCGYGIAVYHETKLRDRDIPVEAAACIPELIPSSDRVFSYDLPAVETMAYTIHRGPFDTLGSAYSALLAWVEKHGYRSVGSTRELYLAYERNGDPAQYVTEVQIPVEPA